MTIEDRQLRIEHFTGSEIIKPEQVKDTETFNELSEYQYLQKRYEGWERWKTSDTFSKGKDSVHFEDDGFISIRKNGDEVAYILNPSIHTFESILKDHGI